MALKKWVLPVVGEKLAAIVAKECDVSELVAAIMVGRGKATPSDAMLYLGNDSEISSPLDMCDMTVAVNRIKSGIDNGERIAIYGDYDCDGITSTAILYSYLLSVGADVTYYIPQREGDGYGLNNAAIDVLHADGVSLIITVDNGISAVSEVQYAKTLKIDIVITDHHQQGETLPNAVAIVNPHRHDDKSEFKELCGAGVVFKLLVALEEDFAYVVENYADLVAVGTVGDIVPLVGENRVLVRYGMDMMKLSDNIGLAALIKVSGITDLTAQGIAFSIVPRINAASRMGDATLALKLLLSEDEGEAVELATKLDELNKARQTQEAEIMAQVEQILLADRSLLNQRVLIVYGKDWNIGVIGIVCSKLVERYGKPVMIMSEHGDVLTGSARSVGEFHLFKALTACASMLARFGGHKMAAGFSLDEKNLARFRVAVENFAQQNCDIMQSGELRIDRVLTRKDMTVEAITSLDVMAPFGAKNEQPLFMIKSARIDGIAPMSNGKHIKLTLVSEEFTCYAPYFGMTIEDFSYKIGDIVDVAVTANLNTYNNKTSVSVFVRDIRDSRFNLAQDKFFAAKGYFEKLIKGEDIPPKIMAIASPTRDEVAVVYRAIRSGARGDYESLYMQLIGSSINYCKLRVIIEVLCELELVRLTTATGSIELCEVDKKIDLNQSKLLQRLAK